jgi:hypothetical protein
MTKRYNEKTFKLNIEPNTGITIKWKFLIILIIMFRESTL